MNGQRIGLSLCVWALLLSFVSCSETKSDQANIPVADTRTKVLFDGNVSFSLPDGLEPVALSVVRPGQELKEGDQAQAYANSGNTVQVIVDLTNIPVKPEDLDEVKQFSERMQKSYSQWEISEITEINGRRWFHFEWQTPPPNELSSLVAPPPLDKDAPTPVPTDKTAVPLFGVLDLGWRQASPFCLLCVTGRVPEKQRDLRRGSPLDKDKELIHEASPRIRLINRNTG